MSLPCFKPIFSEITFKVTFPEPKNEILVAYCCSYSKDRRFRPSGKDVKMKSGDKNIFLP